jgi:molybdopterin converting factor small subunit
MKIRLRLFAALRDYLPPGQPSNEMALDVAEAMSLQAVIDLMSLPAKRVHLVLVNGYHVPPGGYGGTFLKEGDVVAIWPPVAGG